MGDFPGTAAPPLMRTLHLDLGKEWRGGQSQAWLLIRGLRARGHEVELVALRSSALAERAQQEGIAVHGVSRRFSRFQAARTIAALVANNSFAVLHSHEAHGLTAAWLARVPKHIPIVASRRLAYPLQRNPISLARYRGASRLLAVSRFVAESLRESGIEPQKISVVYDGVEIPAAVSAEKRAQARARWGFGDDDLVLGVVGYLLPEKGQDLVVRAWPAIRERSAKRRLILAGDGPSRAALESLAREVGVADSIFFAGHVHDVESVYAALDIFLFPSQAEPLGSSMLAAMAHGLPTVALARGGVVEVIRNESNGLLVEDPSPAAFAAAASNLLRDSALRMRLGSAARQTIEQQFSADRMVEETVRVYKEVSVA